MHSARWPRKGRDKFALIGGETNFTGQCDGANGEFRTYSAQRVLKRKSKTFDGPVARHAARRQRPVRRRQADRQPPRLLRPLVPGAPDLQDGGLVALSEYEDGVRFLQIKPATARSSEQGFFAPLGGSSSSPKWARKDDVVYSLDYDRGIDIIRWQGDHYVPTKAKGKDQSKGHGKGKDKFRPERGRVRGTNGRSTIPALDARQSARRDALAAELQSQGWSPGLCRLIAEQSYGARTPKPSVLATLGG